MSTSHSQSRPRWAPVPHSATSHLRAEWAFIEPNDTLTKCKILPRFWSFLVSTTQEQRKSFTTFFHTRKSCRARRVPLPSSYTPKSFTETVGHLLCGDTSGFSFSSFSHPSHPLFIQAGHRVTKWLPAQAPPWPSAIRLTEHPKC